jgi:hypothetical protein
MSRNANNPWTRTSSRTANNKWKFSYLDNNLVGAITTMQSAQVTAKYSLSSGSAYLCGDNKPPTTAPTIFSTGT